MTVNNIIIDKMTKYKISIDNFTADKMLVIQNDFCQSDYLK